MLDSARSKCLAAADALSLLFFVESCCALCLDASIVVFIFRILVLHGINKTFNGLRGGAVDSRRRGGHALSSPTSSSLSSSSSSPHRSSRAQRRILRRMRKVVALFLFSCFNHVYYVFFSVGAFAGPSAAGVVTQPPPSGSSQLSAATSYFTSSQIGSFLYSARQMLYLTEQSAMTYLLSFLPVAIQPMSLWRGGMSGVRLGSSVLPAAVAGRGYLDLGVGGAGATGGFLSQGATVFLLDIFMFWCLIAIFAALDAAQNGGVCRFKGYTIFAVDDSAHISSLQRERLASDGYEVGGESATAIGGGASAPSLTVGTSNTAMAVQ